MIALRLASALLVVFAASGCRSSSQHGGSPLPAATLVGWDEGVLQVRELRASFREASTGERSEQAWILFHLGPEGHLDQDTVVYELDDMRSLEFLSQDDPQDPYVLPVELTLATGKVLRLWAGQLLGFRGETVPEGAPISREVGSVREVRFERPETR